MRKLLGYILAAAGVLGLAATSVPQIKEKVKLPGQVTDTTLTIISIIVAAVGVFLIVKSGRGKQPREVPIFHGKNVVGYRRH